jgi:hypothetical protein
VTIHCVFSDVFISAFKFYVFYLLLVHFILISLYFVLFEHCGFWCSTGYFGTLV